MTGSDFIKAEMVRLAFHDAFSEGLNGMLAVCFALRNRVRAGWFGGDWIQILSNHKTYSAQTEPYPDTLPDPRVYSIQCLLQEIDGIFSGQTPDTITVAQQSSLSVQPPPVLYYARLDQITNDWFLENISRQPTVHPRSAQVGQMFFFS